MSIKNPIISIFCQHHIKAPLSKRCRKHAKIAVVTKHGQRLVLCEKHGRHVDSYKSWCRIGYEDHMRKVLGYLGVSRNNLP